MAHLRLFGHPALQIDGGKSVRLPPKALTLAAVLVANRARPLSREWLATALWPDADLSESRANLRRHFHMLTRALGEDALLLARYTAQWNGAGPAHTDVARFEDLAESEPALAIGEYGGDLCTGIDEELLDNLRSRYRLRFETLLRSLIEKAQQTKDDALLALCLQRAVAHDPLDEETVRELMRLRHRSGDRAGAVREFNALSQRLRVEIGAEPGAETTALLREIIEDEEHPQIPHNLPAPVTTFVGRERELQHLTQALGEHRIVTIAGTGGIGKTRLATRAGANLLQRYPDGVRFIDLEFAQTEESIWDRIAEVLASSAESAQNGVLGKLAASKTLIVLDTCEHAVDAVRAVAELIVSKTTAAILATSRRRLEAQAEYVIPLEPLEIPPASILPADSPLRYGAYRLFLERAAMSNPAFRAENRQIPLICELLRSLDGLPLAIELIASRADVLTIEGMRKRLAATMRTARRGQSGGATLEDALYWSYDLLSSEQRVVFERLSLFRAAFTAEDAEALCMEIPNAADLLFDLLDASLVAIRSRDSEIRYAFLETTREFAGARLAENAGATRGGESHAELFANKAAELARLPESRFEALMEMTVACVPDYLAALDTCIALRRPELGAGILETVHRCASRRHLAGEFLRRLQALQQIANAQPELEARLRLTSTRYFEKLGMYQASLEQSGVAADFFRRTGDAGSLRVAMSAMAVDLFHLGDYEECERILLEVREGAERDGDEAMLVKTQGRLAALSSRKGDFESSRAHLAAASAALRAGGHVAQLGMALRNLAISEFFCGDYSASLGTVQEVLDLPGTRSDVDAYVIMLSLQANCHRELGAMQSALACHLKAAALFRDLKVHSLCDCLEDAAGTLAACGQQDTAALCCGFTGEARLRATAPRNIESRTTYEATMRRLESLLGADLERLQAQGASLSEPEIAGIAFEALRKAKDNEVTTSLS